MRPCLRRNIHIISVICILLTENLKLQKKENTVLRLEVFVFWGLVQVKGVNTLELCS